MTQNRYFAVGCSDSLLAQLGASVGADVQPGFPIDGSVGDVVFLACDGRDLPHGNAFAACRELKRQHARIRVFVIVEDADRVSEEIARFCLADGCVQIDAAGNLCEPDALAASLDAESKRVPLDALLKRLERDADPDSMLQRMSEKHASHPLMDQLTDPETGLFDGPFASFKLDEEFKRAMRFHQPLSLILLDCGGELPERGEDRRMVLAEIASVFLNECRDIDILARFTETVFLFLLPGTGSDGARTMTRRMLDELRDRRFTAGYRIEPVAGIATVPMAGIDTRREFLARAEACLEVARTDQDRRGLCAL
ncbi:MAG: hypothetical protein KDB80_17790 [Planctomycetes bacterium]|nr:hypothetical protein [Planctomycetota bacterium]